MFSDNQGKGRAMAILFLLIGMALGFCVALALSIVGCAIYNEWWPLFALFLWFASVIPEFLSRLFASKASSDLSGEETTGTVEHVGAFISAFFVISGFAVNGVLFHGGGIVWQNLLFQIPAGILFVATAGLSYGIYKLIIWKTGSEF